MGFLESGLTETWILQTLQADATLAAAGIYGYVVPQGSTFPCLVLSLVTALDSNALNGFRGATEVIYLVKAIAAGSDSSGADALMARADGLLQRQSGTVTGLKILSCHRESVVKFSEKFDGKTYWHIGGQYRIWVEQA